MDITIKEVQSKKDLRLFIQLPAKIHKGHENWVPPIYMDDRFFFNPLKNETFNHSDTIRLLAFIGEKAVGRIMGIINHIYNNKHQLEEGRFCFLETYNEYEIANKLIEYVENWARTKGMKVMVGPVGFSDKDPQGMLVEGYDNPVVISTNYNFPYMVNFLEKTNYSKKVDLVVYRLQIPDEVPRPIQSVYSRTLNSYKDLHILHFKTTRQLRPYIRPTLSLLNETFQAIYAFADLSIKEMDEFANRYLMILDPRFIKLIADDNNRIVAFIIAMPDVSEGIRKCKGYILPFGIFYIFRAMKKTKQLNLLLGGIHEEYRNRGLDSILAVHIFNEAKAKGLHYIDSHLILETNLKMRGEVEKYDGKVYKRYRIFKKNLN